MPNQINPYCDIGNITKFGSSVQPIPDLGYSVRVKIETKIYSCNRLQDLFYYLAGPFVNPIAITP